MIWIWAFVGILISFLLFRKNKIPYYHFIWILFPIDYYGLNIGGMTIKPFMFFGLVLILIKIIKDKTIVPKAIIFVLPFISIFLLCDIGSGFILASVLQHLLFIFVLLIAYFYTMYCKEIHCLKHIEMSISASSIGFGIICLFAIFAFSSNISIPGLFSTSESLIRVYLNMDGLNFIETYRLCGFESDPNAFCIFYIISITVNLYSYLNDRKNNFIYLCGFILSLICIVFSKSRSGLIVSLFIILLITFICFRKMINQKRYLLICSLFIAVFTLLISVILGDLNISNWFTNITNSAERSNLFDRLGRFTIWVENLGNMFKNNAIFGLGANQSYLYSSVSRACHNTWVELICSLGIIFGPIICIMLILPLFKTNNKDFRVLKIAFLSICILLFTIDYFANVYFLTLFCLLKNSNFNKKVRLNGYFKY